MGRGSPIRLKVDRFPVITTGAYKSGEREELPGGSSFLTTLFLHQLHQSFGDFVHGKGLQDSSFVPSLIASAQVSEAAAVASFWRTVYPPEFLIADKLSTPPLPDCFPGAQGIFNNQNPYHGNLAFLKFELIQLEKDLTIFTNSCWLNLLFTIYPIAPFS